MKIGVIGAGTMGSGIAQAFAQTEGYEVVLCDINEEFAANGKKKIAKGNGGVVVEGVDNLLTRLSHCCSPIPGDEIVGYITKGRGVSVHRVDCPNIKSAEQSGQRIVQVYWSNPEGDKTNYNADIEVQGYNRNGMLNDVLHSINNNTRFLTSVNGKVDNNRLATISASVGVHNLAQLRIIMDALKNIPDVYVVKRVIH